jgi:hypothetical protein
MYLIISELTVNKRWSPKMCDFFQDHESLWWFVTVGKGNKERHIAVSSSMLSAIKCQLGLPVATTNFAG